MASRSRYHHRPFDVWPGFVDAFAAQLMIIVAVLMILVAAQFFLTNALSNRDIALQDLTQKLRSLNERLIAETARGGELTSALKRLEVEKTNALATASQEKEARSRVTLDLAALSDQVTALNEQLLRLNAALELSHTESQAKDVEIGRLTTKLNDAMLDKVEELAEYRSEFFGKLRKALGNRPDIRVVGDRFVFQSEVLFPSGSATLEEGGKKQLQQLAATLKEIIPTIPSDLNWTLEVIGHTDKRPISNVLFASNWELSIARALSVVRFLIEEGLSADRLAASGYAEFQPLEQGDEESSLQKNRRIELKLTQK